MVVPVHLNNTTNKPPIYIPLSTFLSHNQMRQNLLSRLALVVNVAVHISPSLHSNLLVSLSLSALWRQNQLGQNLLVYLSRRDKLLCCLFVSLVILFTHRFFSLLTNMMRCSLEGNKDFHKAVEQHMDGVVAQTKELDIHGLDPLLHEHYVRAISLFLFKTKRSGGVPFPQRPRHVSAGLTGGYIIATVGSPSSWGCHPDSLSGCIWTWSPAPLRCWSSSVQRTESCPPWSSANSWWSRWSTRPNYCLWAENPVVELSGRHWKHIPIMPFSMHGKICRFCWVLSWRV